LLTHTPPVLLFILHYHLTQLIFHLSSFFFFPFFFFFNDTATTEIYTLSLHDALPILSASSAKGTSNSSPLSVRYRAITARSSRRSEEHTSELQSPCNLVCRLLLEKKKKKKKNIIINYRQKASIQHSCVRVVASLSSTI